MKTVNLSIFSHNSASLWFIYFIIYFSKVLFIFEKWEGREKEREGNMDVWEIHQVVASPTSPNGHLAYNPGLCPKWESDQQSFGSQASAQSTETHQQGLFCIYLILMFMPIKFLQLVQNKNPFISKLEYQYLSTFDWVCYLAYNDS